MYKKEVVCNCTITIGTNFEMSLIRASSNTKKSLTMNVKTPTLYPFSERTNFQILVKGNKNQIVVGPVTYYSKHKPREQS